jgi:hypothetical protein
MRSDSPLKFGAMLPNARKASPATADFPERSQIFAADVVAVQPE